MTTKLIQLNLLAVLVLHMISAVYSTVNITISPGAVVEGGQFSIQCTYDVPLFHLSIKRTGKGDGFTKAIKAAEYLKATGQTSVHKTLRDRATFYPGNNTLIVRDAKSSEDAAMYRCEVTPDGPAHYSGVPYLQVYEFKSDPVLEIPTVTSGTEATLKCTVDGVKPVPRLMWSTSTNSTLQEGSNITTANPDGTWKVISTWSKTFTKSDDGSTVNCVAVNTTGTPVELNKTSATVNVQYAPESSVTAVANNKPIKGQSITLQCTVEAKPIQTAVRWYKGRSTITSGGRLQISSDQLQLTIASLTTDDDGDYSCIATNTIGEGTSKADYKMEVLYPPVVSVADPGNSKTREDVDTVTITCTANAKPSSFTAVEWYRGSQRITITGRYMDGTPQRPSLTIKPVKRVDSGKYTCKIQNEIGWGNKTTNVALDVTYCPTLPKSGLILPKSEIAVNTEVNMTCSTSDPGNPVAKSFTWTKTSNNSWTHQQATNVFAYRPMSVKDSGAYMCEASNVVCGSDKSDAKALTIKAPPTVESPTQMQSKNIIFNDTDKLLAECVVSGDPLPNIKWLVNSTPIEENNFDLQTTEVNGAYKYDQTKARKGVLKWKSAPNLTCSTVAKYAGRYICVGKDNGFGGDITSQEVNVEILYPPIYRGTGFSASDTGVPKVLECEVCANPVPGSYTWLHKGKPPRAGMTQEGSKLKIDTVQEGDFGVFTCKVTNRIESKDYTSSFDIELTAQGPPHMPKGLRAKAVGSSVIVLEWTSGFNGGFTQTFTVESKQSSDDAYAKLKESIPDPSGGKSVIFNVTGLKAETEYMFRVQSISSRTSDNTSPYATLTKTTSVLPKVIIEDVQVKADQVIVKWKTIKGKPDRLSLQYRQSNRRRRAVSKTEDGFTILNDNIMPNETTVSVPGTFDTDAAYEFRLVIYENGISMPTSGPTHSYTKTQSAGGVATAGIIGGIVAAILVILIIILVVLVIRKRRAGTQKERQNMELKSSGYSQIPNDSTGSVDDVGSNAAAIVDKRPLPSDSNGNSAPADPTYAVVNKGDKNGNKAAGGRGVPPPPPPSAVIVLNPETSPVYSEVKKKKKKKDKSPQKEVAAEDPSALYAQVDKPKKESDPVAPKRRLGGLFKGKGKPTQKTKEELFFGKLVSESQPIKPVDPDSLTYAEVTFADRPGKTPAQAEPEGPYANVGPAGITPVPAVPENPYMNVDPVNLEQESTLYENIPGKAPPKPQNAAVAGGPPNVVIHGAGEGTEYASIDFTRKAPPVNRESDIIVQTERQPLPPS